MRQMNACLLLNLGFVVNSLTRAATSKFLNLLSQILDTPPLLIENLPSQSIILPLSWAVKKAQFWVPTLRSVVVNVKVTLLTIQAFIKGLVLVSRYLNYLRTASRAEQTSIFPLFQKTNLIRWKLITPFVKLLFLHAENNVHYFSLPVSIYR